MVLEMIGIGLLLGMAIRFLSLGDRENCVAFYRSKKLRKRRPFGAKDLTCCLDNQEEMEAGVWERWHNYVFLFFFSFNFLFYLFIYFTLQYCVGLRLIP